MHKALLVGGGAREHAIAKRLCESSELISAMKHKNPGIMRLAKKVLFESDTNAEKIAEFAAAEKPDFAFVGPDAALGAGVADAIEAKGIPCVGASQKAAMLETNKLFCRQFLKDNGINCNPDFFAFDDAQEAVGFLKGMEKAVVKPLGLTGGKGVKVMGTQVPKQEALDYAAMLVKKDGMVLVEECLEGEEFSLQAFVSGDIVIEMPLVQDHKRAFENDLGANTGGMGSYSDANHLLPFVSLEEKNQALEAMRQTMRAVKKSGVEYKGILYGQFMLTRKGPKLVEYNARFADPESMNVLSLLQSDFTELCWKIIDGTLSQKHASFEKKATVVKYAVPEGYPDNPLKGAEIMVDEGKINSLGGEVFYASVSEENGRLSLGGSRAIAVLGKGGSIGEAEGIAQKAIETVKGKIFYRKDIGTKELIEKRIGHMRTIKG